MKTLPDYVMRSPSFCYVLGALIFVGYIGVGMYEIAAQNQYQFDSSPMTVALRLRTILDALSYASYSVISGIFLQVHLAIWRTVVARQSADNEASE